MMWYNPFYNWQNFAKASENDLYEYAGWREWAFVDAKSGDMLAFKSFMRLNYSVNHKVINSAISDDFVSYNKLINPEELDVQGAIKGKPEEISNAIDALIYYSQSTDLLNVLTPDRYFTGFNMYKLSYKREAKDGVDLVIFEAKLQEIRQVETQYTNVKIRRTHRSGVKQADNEAFLKKLGDSTWRKYNPDLKLGNIFSGLIGR